MRFREADNLLISFDNLEIMFWESEQSLAEGMRLEIKPYLETKKHVWRALEQTEFIFGYTDEQWALIASAPANNDESVYKWLHEMAEKQAKDISEYLIVKVYFCYYSEGNHLPRVVFGVDIYNKSVFDLAIEDAMNGHIEVEGHALQGSKQYLHRVEKISPSSEGSLTIEQRLLPDEVALVKEPLKTVFGAYFYFNKLDIKVKSAIPFAQFKEMRLLLPDRINYVAESQKRELIFEINENQTHVGFSGGSEVRRLEVSVNLRYINSGTEPNIIQDMRAALYKEGTPDKEETIIKQEVRRLEPESMKSLDFTNGLKIDGSTQTPFEFVMFYLEISQETEARLSPDHFLRITMKAMRQSDYAIDFYINSLRDAHFSNSSIRLK